MRDALAAGIQSSEPGFKFRRAAGGGPLRPYLLESILEFFVPYEDRSSSQARRRLGEALEGAGDNSELKAVLSYLAAWANRSAARVSAGREENRRRELLKQCLELDPKAARAALELSQYYTTTFSNPALADDYARAAVGANPQWIEARIYASRVVAMKGLDMEVERELAKLLQEHPSNGGVLRFSAYYAGLRRDYKLSNELFEKALKADYTDTYSRARLLERAVARGDTKAALRLAAETRRLDPFDTGASAQLADMFLHAEKHSLAERELNRALEIVPRDDALLEQLGHVYSAWADADDARTEDLRARALDAYTRALEANPRREDIERYLEFLEGEQPPFEAALQEDITARIQAALASEVDGDNPYEVIYRDKIVVVNEDGTTSQYIQEALRVTNDNGRNWLQRLPVPAWSDQQGRCVEARVWRADGDIEEGRRSRWSASFPPLDIGDVVHVRFRVTDREQSFFGDFYGAREVFMDYVPVHEVRYAWVLPPGRKFYDYRTGDAPERAESSVNGRAVWQYRATSLPKLHDEPLAPPPHQRGATVQISTYENWKDFGRWYYNLIRKQLEPTPEMTVKVNELTAGAKTEREKARAVYNWVVTEVRYNADWHFGVHGYKPFSAGAVFARAIGDCKDKAILICTMLRIAGIDAYPVIINLEPFRGDEDITLPMPHHFNHAIAWIEFSDGEGVFVDGTTTYNGIDELSAADRGANVIVVRPEGGVVTRIPAGAPEDDSQTDEIDATFAGGGTLELSVTRTAVGDSAGILRMRYQREGDRRKSIEQEWARHYPGASVSDIEANDLSDLDTPPRITFKVKLPNAYTEKDGTIEFRTGLDPREWTQTEFASLTTRRTDLLTPAPFERVNITRFNLPRGFKPAALPDPLKIDHAGARLSVTVEGADGVLTVTRSYALLGGTVRAEDYPAFRRELIRYDSAESAPIRLKK
jgi:cellulose synthase operon protein C